MKRLSYFKKYPDKNYQLEVIVEFLDKNEIGSVVDCKIHSLDYIPTGKTIYTKD